jgi:hypothetical protein
MRRASAFLVLGTAWLSSCSGTTPGPAAGGWVRLFNGEDLSGWVAVKGTLANWGVEGGLLVCHGRELGWISTSEPYENFELELEYRMSPGGNSGILVRTPREGHPSKDGMEIQILDDEAPAHQDILPSQHTGAIYKAVAPSKPAHRKAGEWNRIRILCDGSRVTVRLNGEEIVNADLDRHEELRLRPRRGYVGLQNHKSRVEFRDVRLRRLP